MARPLRIEFPGAIHHVTSRMIGSWVGSRERLFRDDRDYHRFLKRLGEGVDTFGIRLYLCTLMSNHFHLVLETPQANLSRFMQSLSTAYTVYFNRRHRRHGHLLDGRYKAKLVAGDEYLLKLTRYVHQNPVWVSDWARKPIKGRIAHLQAAPGQRSFGRWNVIWKYCDRKRRGKVTEVTWNALHCNLRADPSGLPRRYC